MEYALIFCLLILFGGFLYLVYNIIKWILAVRKRRIVAFSIIGVLLTSFGIKKVFFEKMEFIQSNVYPDLFLVKYPTKVEEELNLSIKNKLLQELKKRYNSKDLMHQKFGDSLTEYKNAILFYEYTNAWGFDLGTKHFIENKEDPGGFSSEDLNKYQVYRKAYFIFDYCRNDSLHLFGELNYYKNGSKVKSETILNQCQKIVN